MQGDTLCIGQVYRVALYAHASQKSRYPTLSVGINGIIVSLLITAILGAEKIGEVVVDFTFLRDQGLIQPLGGGWDVEEEVFTKRHYLVIFNMEINVVDRDLQCECLPYGRA